MKLTFRNFSQDNLAAPLEFFQNLPEKVRHWTIGDTSQSGRDEAFYAAIAQAAQTSDVCLAYINNEPVALGYLLPVCCHSRTMLCHAVLPPLPFEALVEIADGMLGIPVNFYQAIVCTIPRPLRVVRRVVEAVGFEHKATFPKSCFLSAFGRCFDGELYYKQGNPLA